jgi:hypothetical protein
LARNAAPFDRSECGHRQRDGYPIGEAFASGIQRRLRMTENVEAILGAMSALAEHCIARMRKFPEGDRRYHKVVFFFFCKAYKTFQAFGTLCKAGFIEDAEVLARTIFELFLQANWLEADPNTNARLFFEHAPVKEYVSYLRLKRCENSPTIKRVVELLESKKQEKLAEAEKRYDASHAQFLKPGVKVAKRPDDISDNWWNGSVHWLAVKLKIEDQYAFVYASQSDLVHTGSKVILQYLKPTEDGIVANCYPTPGEELWLSASWVAGWFLGIIEVLNQAWRLNLDDEIQNTAQAVTKITRVEREKDQN